MSKTINSAVGSITLTVHDNPLNISPTGAVTSSSSSSVYAIQGAAGTDWRVTNAGLINGSISIGTGKITNKGTIEGASILTAATIENSGAINMMNLGGINTTVLTNKAGASISGNNKYGFIRIGNGGILTNKGDISDPIFLTDGGTLVNDRLIGGTIRVQTNPGTITNTGSILGSAYTGPSFGPSSGITLDQGGTVVNSGLIKGQIGFGNLSLFAGVNVTGGTGTVLNSGTISGANSVLFSSATSNNRLIIEPGAIFNGAATATLGTNSTIELAKGSGKTGEIDGVGTGKFNGFDNLVVDKGATWTLSGANTINKVSDDGTLGISGSLTVTTVDSASGGKFDLLGVSRLEVGSVLGINTKMSFMKGDGELVIDHYTQFGQNVGTSNYDGMVLQGFGAGDKIDLKDFAFAGATVDYTKQSGLLQLANASGQHATLDFQNSSLGAGSFHAANDGASGVLITHV